MPDIISHLRQAGKKEEPHLLRWTCNKGLSFLFRISWFPSGLSLCWQKKQPGLMPRGPWRKLQRIPMRLTHAQSLGVLERSRATTFQLEKHAVWKMDMTVYKWSFPHQSARLTLAPRVTCFLMQCILSHKSWGLSELTFDHVCAAFFPIITDFYTKHNRIGQYIYRITQCLALVCDLWLICICRALTLSFLHLHRCDVNGQNTSVHWETVKRLSTGRSQFHKNKVECLYIEHKVLDHGSSTSISCESYSLQKAQPHTAMYSTSGSQPEFFLLQVFSEKNISYGFICWFHVWG